VGNEASEPRSLPQSENRHIFAVEITYVSLSMSELLIGDPHPPRPSLGLMVSWLFPQPNFLVFEVEESKFSHIFSSQSNFPIITVDETRFS
jgi:hypothetical protein